MEDRKVANEDGKDTSKFQKKFVEWKRTLVELKTSLGHAIEEPSFVILFLLLAYADILLGSMNLYGAESLGNISIERLRTITLYLQCCELLLQLCIFHARFFSHWGYALDSFLVVGRFIRVDPRRLHLLSFLRVWRFFRVVQTYVAIERSKHDRTREELTSQIESTKEWRRKARTKKEGTDREERLSKQNELTVKMCREEIGTLREALQIAALDVAAMKEKTGVSDQVMEGVVDVDVVEIDSNGGDDNGDVWPRRYIPCQKKSL